MSVPESFKYIMCIAYKPKVFSVEFQFTSDAIYTVLWQTIVLLLLAVAQWLRGRASDSSRLRGPGFESCAAV